MNTITTQDVDAILEAELASHDPAAPSRLFTVLQGLLTPTAQQTSKNVVYLHRGINATKRVFFRALCVSLGGCGWVTASSLDDATKLLSGYKQRERYPALLVLDNIPSGTLVEWRHLMSLAATPGVQIHALQDIAWPHEHLALPTASVEQYDWRDISGNAVVLRDDAVMALAPAIASWLGDDAAKLLPAEPETSRTTLQIACRKDPCLAPARSAPAVLHLGCGIGCDEDHSKPTIRLTIDGKPVRGMSEIAWEETAPTPSVSSSATTTPVDAPSSVSPSAVTWPQESATTATQDSTHSSAETWKPVGTERSGAPQKVAGPLAVMQARAAATAVYPGAGTGDSDARYYTALALAGEAGEVAGKASKVLRDGESSALMEALYAELGDVLWHWLQCCAEWGAQPDQVAEAMFQRLQDRQARGKLRGSGDAR